jgi:hypothetical protein
MFNVKCIFFAGAKRDSYHDNTNACKYKDGEDGLLHSTVWLLCNIVICMKSSRHNLIHYSKITTAEAREK